MQAAPVRNVTFSSLTFTGAASTFLDPSAMLEDANFLAVKKRSFLLGAAQLLTATRSA